MYNKNDDTKNYKPKNSPAIGEGRRVFLGVLLGIIFNIFIVLGIFAWLIYNFELYDGQKLAHFIL